MATIKLETFTPGTSQVVATTFVAKLQNAVNNAPNGTVIDCTSYSGRINSRVSITITRSVTLLFGNITFGFTGGGNLNMFNIQAPNVKIKGVNNTSKNNTNAGATRLLMTTQGAGYHIYVGATADLAEQQNWVSQHGFELHDVELKGLGSIVEKDDDDTALYTRTGCGGVQIIKGSPFSGSEFIDDVVLKNVVVNGSRNHGVLMLGARSATISNCTVIDAGGHGIMMDGGKSNVIEACRAESCKLAGFFMKDEQFSTLESCLTVQSGLGYFLRSTKSVTLSSCGAEKNIDRGSQPLSYKVPIYVPLTFILDDVNPLHMDSFDGSSYLVTGQQNYNDGCGGDAQYIRYGYTCVNGKQTRQLQVGTGGLEVPCGLDGDCPEGFACGEGNCVPDLTDNLWVKVGQKPSGGAIYRGPGYQMHDPNGNGGIELHTGWDDGEELRVYGVVDPSSYGFVEYEGERFRQLITSAELSGVGCNVENPCPPGFICSETTAQCIPDTNSLDPNDAPYWTLLGNKPNIDTPVYTGPLNIQLHTGWGDSDDLIQRLYYKNNNDLNNFSNEGTILSACYSKDPGNRGDSIFYENGLTTHFKFVDAFYNVEIINPLIKQPYGTKYKMMFLLDTGETWERWPSYSMEGGNMSTYAYNTTGDLDNLQVADVLDLTD